MYYVLVRNLQFHAYSKLNSRLGNENNTSKSSSHVFKLRPKRNHVCARIKGDS